MTPLTIIAPHGHEPAMAGKPHGNRVRALFEPLLAHQRILHQILALKLGDWLSAALLETCDPMAVRDRALARCQRLPERDTLHAWDDELCHVLEDKADEKTLSLLLAIMLDGFPQAKSQSVKTYVDAALVVIGDTGLSPEIAAAAIARGWRKNRFPPSIAEFLDEYEEAAKAAAGTRRVVTKMLALLDNAEDVLVATGNLNDAPAFRPRRGGEV